jgi:hypothetical protein
MQRAERILIVDDDAGLRELLCDYLEREGFSVAAVADAPAMGRRLAEQQADLVILDVMLPGEDGLSIARRLRVGGDVPIMKLTESSAWKWARTIIYQSRSIRVSCWRASAPCFAGAPPCRPARFLARVRGGWHSGHLCSILTPIH